MIRITLGRSGQAVDRTDLVDLMNIDNPDHLYGPVRAGDMGVGQRFTFPFFLPSKILSLKMIALSQCLMIIIFQARQGVMQIWRMTMKSFV